MVAIKTWQVLNTIMTRCTKSSPRDIRFETFGNLKFNSADSSHHLCTPTPNQPNEIEKSKSWHSCPQLAPCHLGARSSIKT